VALEPLSIGALATSVLAALSGATAAIWKAAQARKAKQEKEVEDLRTELKASQKELLQTALALAKLQGRFEQELARTSSPPPT
jgi:hypothetical protein